MSDRFTWISYSVIKITAACARARARATENYFVKAVGVCDMTRVS